MPLCLILHVCHTVFSLLTGDYGSVFSLVTNTELQPVKTLMSHALVCPLNKADFTILKSCQYLKVYSIEYSLTCPEVNLISFIFRIVHC